MPLPLETRARLEDWPILCLDGIEYGSLDLLVTVEHDGDARSYTIEEIEVVGYPNGKRETVEGDLREHILSELKNRPQDREAISEAIRIDAQDQGGFLAIRRAA